MRIGRLIAIVALAWALGFVAFAAFLPRPLARTVKTDGIVVLTGGAGRLQRGLDMLDAGAARRLLVSGVDRHVRRDQLAARQDIPARLLGRVDLGREAVDTRSNAEEAQGWVARHGYRSIRLVTTDWHMRRARWEATRTLGPGVTIRADAVPSEPGLLALLREYNKYLLRRAAALIGRD